MAVMYYIKYGTGTQVHQRNCDQKGPRQVLFNGKGRKKGIIKIKSECKNVSCIKAVIETSRLTKAGFAFGRISDVFNESPNAFYRK